MIQLIDFDKAFSKEKRYFTDISVRDKMREVFVFLHRTSNMETATEPDRFLYNFLYFIYGKEYEYKKRLRKQ